MQNKKSFVFTNTFRPEFRKETLLCQNTSLHTLGVQWSAAHQRCPGGHILMKMLVFKIIQRLRLLQQYVYTAINTQDTQFKAELSLNVRP